VAGRSQALGDHRRRLLREAVLVVGAAALLAVLVTWPLVLVLDDHAHDMVDTLFVAWTIDWVQHALGSSAPLWDANIYAPEPRTLAYSDPMLGMAVLLLPARWLGLSPIGVLNVGLLLGYTASAASGYLFGRVVTRSVVVGACTGVVYGFGTFNAFLAQHVQVLFHPGPALAATAVWVLADRLDEGRSPLPAAAALSAVIVLHGTTAFYVVVITVVAAVLIALVRLPSLRLRGVAIGGGAAAAALVLLMPVLWPYLQHDDWAREGYELSSFDLFSPNFLAVDEGLTFWGPLLGAPFTTYPTFPGVVVLLLAVGGLTCLRRSGDRLPMVAIGVLLAVGILLAFGTSHVGWRRFAPFRLVYEFVPGGYGFRATPRFWLVGLLGLGVLVGIGVRRLGVFLAGRLDRPRGPTMAVTATVCCALILAEGHKPWTDLPEVPRRPVDIVLSERPESGGVLYLPVHTSGFGRFAEAGTVYRTTAHHRPTPNGYSGLTPPSFEALPNRLATLPGDDALDHLREIGVRFVVVSPGGGRWSHLSDPAQAAPLRPLGRYGGELLYEVPPPRRGSSSR
jgi:hypothetical protein